MNKKIKQSGSGVSVETILSPKQEAFLKYYYDVNSTETFANAYASAVAAGYSDSYAKILTAPSIKNMWIRQNNKTALTPEHITSIIEKIAMKGMREGDQLRALELLAKFHGMIVDKTENKNLNIEMALEDLK